MYWYYKAFLASIVGVILWGIYSLVSPHLPSIPAFSSKADPIEKEEPTETPGNIEKTPNTVKKKNLIAKRDLTPNQSKKLLEAKELFEKDQRLDDAYELAMEIFEDKSLPIYSKGWYKIADFISKVNTTLLLSSAPSNRKENHLVKGGDSLSRIATTKSSTIRGLQKGNNIPADSINIHPGDVIRFFGGQWSIEVIQSQYLLVITHKGRFFKYYKVGIGQLNRTPLGKFLIYGKVEDPIWERKGQEAIQSGDPRNVLGTRWMKLKPQPGTIITGSGYGIHGTTDPDSIGTPASQGCIRMKNEQVEELFDIIPDTKVEVTIRK